MLHLSLCAIISPTKNKLSGKVFFVEIYLHHRIHDIELVVEMSKDPSESFPFEYLIQPRFFDSMIIYKFTLTMTSTTMDSFFSFFTTGSMQNIIVSMKLIDIFSYP